MGISTTTIYSSAVMLALVIGGPAQAQKGPPAGAPGQMLKGGTTSPNGHGGSGLAPGYTFKDTFKGTPGGASSLGGVGKQGDAPGQAIAPGYLKNNPVSQ
jgi:hypothetical protein